MDALYPCFSSVSVCSSPGSSSSVLPSRLSSFYRWVWKLSQQEGFCWACTPYLAKKQGVSERTVYRWLSDLRRFGFISSEQTPGVERRVFPQKEPTRPKKMSGVCQGSLSGVSSSRVSDAGEAPTAGANVRGSVSTGAQPVGSSEKAEQPSAVVNRLTALGVSSPIAAQLVRTHGEAAVLAQLEALPFRKPRNQAAALVASVLNRWQLPSACSEAQRGAQDRARKSSAMALEAAARASEAQRRAEARKRLDALPEGERRALEQRVRAALASELPAAARLMLPSRAGAAWVQARMLADLEGGE
jgi:hypothetical protein